MIERQRNTIVVQKEKEVLSLYLTGMTQKEVAHKTGLGASSVFNILKANNASRSMHHYRKHKLNQRYFSKINTEAKAYLLGFIFADGCLRINESRKRFSLAISVHRDDRYVLDLVKRELATTYEIITERKNYVRLTVNSEALLRDLVRFGLRQNKTHDIQFPNVPKGLVRHFIRGYFDGDGSIFEDKTQNKLRVSFTGHIPFLIGVEKNLPVSCRWIVDGRTPNHGSLRINTQYDVKMLGGYLYKDSNYFLTRKYNKWGLLS